MTETVRKWKRGDVHPETGLVFKQYDYRRGCREVWIAASTFAAYMKAEQKPRDQSTQTWRRGDMNPDTGLVFLKYRGSRESWGTVEKLKEENARGLKYFAANRERYRQNSARWTRANPHKVSAKSKRWRIRHQNCPLFILKKSVRDRLYRVVNQAGYRRSSRSAQIIGCDWAFLRSYIEARFLPGMTWANHGEWHLDHVVPLASARTKRDVIRLSHYTNLRPLWAKDNLAKGDSMPTQQTLPL